MTPIHQPDLTDFVCHRCGNCCRGEGVVRVDDAKLGEIATYLKLTLVETQERYLKLSPSAQRTQRFTGLKPETISTMQGRPLLELYRQDDGWFHLKSQPVPELDCIFLVDNLCAIQPVKPQQCRTFPFEWINDDSYETCEGLRALQNISPSKPENTGRNQSRTPSP
jgi:Fe-S-cluster containining protein